MRKGEVNSGGIKNGNEEPLTHLMDYPFGLIHSSETPYLTITYVTSTYQINIVV